MIMILHTPKYYILYKPATPKWIRMNEKPAKQAWNYLKNKQFTTKCNASGYHKRISIKNKRRSKSKENPKKRPNPFQPIPKKNSPATQAGINPSPSQTRLKQREHLHLK
jgi:hypothetical protein